MVDVILPVFNGRRWVAEAVDSLRAQTDARWRLTIVDDASTDDSLSMLKDRYDGLADQIGFIRLEANRRAAGARMEAIRRTQGEFIAFLDQDDRWHPRKLELQLERLNQAPAVEAVHTDETHIDDRGKEIPESADRPNSRRGLIAYDRMKTEEFVRRQFRHNCIRLVSVLIRRSAFEQAGGFDESLFGGEDWEFWVRFAAGGFRAAHLARPLLQRRIHEGHAGRVWRAERQEGRRRAMEKVLAAHPELTDLAEDRKTRLQKKDPTDG